MSTPMPTCSSTQNNVEALRAIACELVAPGRTTQELIPYAQALRDLLESETQFRIDWDQDPFPQGTQLDSGIAISPTYAAMCLRELARTSAFIRGLARAIEEARSPGRSVRVLYAGCGPYALLALPLMTLWSAQEVRFTLVDVHAPVLDSAARLLERFGVGDRVDELVCADAARYRIPQGREPDVIVSETMTVCLHKEPQVSIVRNLLAQAPQARLVPRAISVDLCLLNLSAEHRLMPADYEGEIPPPERERITLGNVFELDADAIQRWNAVKGEWLPGGHVRIPARVPAGFRPYLLTRIHVYGEERLQDYDCSLTIPQRLTGGDQLMGGDALQFNYRLGSKPELAFRKV